MISRRGKPDHGEAVVHFKKPASWDGLYDAQPLCSYGGWHVLWADTVREVTCPDCRKRLEELKPR